MTSANSFGTRQSLMIGNDTVEFYSLQALIDNGYPNVSVLPYSLKVLLENMLRREDGQSVTPDDIEAYSPYL